MVRRKLPRPCYPHRGLTLVELLIAMTIIAMTAASLAALARAAQVSAAYVQGHSQVAQHARVTSDRLQQALHSAPASETFPGAAVFAQTESGARFPETLVVWKPATGVSPQDPQGAPRFSELVVYCPDPSAPHQLLEITARSDHRTVPPLSDTNRWNTELAALKANANSQKIVLTDRLRTARLTATATLRGCVRFEVVLRPSAAQLTSMRSGNLTWEDLRWPQHWYGDTTGLRQTWVRWELQLMPHARSGGEAADVQAIPFPGSAALYYEVHR